MGTLMGIYKQKQICVLDWTLICYILAISRSVISEKNTSYSLMTPYTDNLLIILTKFYPELTSVSPAIYHMTKITWDHRREISCDESHYFRKLGNWISVIFGKSHDVFGNVWKRHFWKNDSKFDFIFLLDFFPN